MATASFKPNATYLHILEQARQDFNQSHAHLSERQRQELWVHTLSSNASISDVQASQVPRSMSYSNANINQVPTSDHSSMDRTYSAPAYVTDGRLNTSSTIPQRSTSSSSWQVPGEERTSQYSLVSGIPSARNPEPFQANTDPSTGSILEYDPAEYVNRYIDTSVPHPLSLPQAQDSSRLHPQLTIDSQWASSSFDGQDPESPPGLMTPVTVADSNMSRQGSANSNSHFGEDNSMLRIHSASSTAFSSLLNEDGTSPISFPYVDAKNISACVDTSLFPMFTGSSSSEFFLSPAHASPSASALGPSSVDKAYLAEDMRRSLSTSSESSDDISSMSSSGSRQWRRDQEIKALASRKIAPKAAALDEMKSASSNIQMKRVLSDDGSSKDLAQITKAPYIRPQHPKIMCHYCNDRPEGFRGTHELDRHIARVHATVRKGYICIDNSENKKFLANCKHCRNKKVYGAYYNAAAHLRRAHFNPRKRGRKGKHDQKRGGIGGGDKPAMEILKQFWIQEIEVENSIIKKPASDSSNSSPIEAPEDFEYESANTTTYPHQDSTEMSVPFDFNPSTFMYGVDGQYESMPQFSNPSTVDFSNFQFDPYMAQ